MRLKLRSGQSPASLVVSALLLVTTAWGTHVETFSDPNCQTISSEWNGPNGFPDGECTSVNRNGNITSFKIIKLNPGCAITIYGPGTNDGPCDSNAAPGAIVADGGTCYNNTWSYYSIDNCIKPGGAAESSSTVVPGTSRTSPTSSINSAQISATSTPSAEPHGGHTNVGAIVGGVVGGVGFGIIVTAGCIICFTRYRRSKRNRLPPELREGPHSSYGLTDMGAKELPSGTDYNEGRASSVRSAPGMRGAPQELPTEGIPEMPNHPIAELDGFHGDIRPRSPRDVLKK